MHDRSKSRRWAVLVLVVGALMAAPLLAHAGPAKPVASTSTSEDTRLGRVQITAPVYARNIVWWPFSTGPYYGDTSSERGDNVIYTPVGSFRLGEELPLPVELKATEAAFARGMKQYFLIQMRPSALLQPDWEASLATLGVTIAGHLPVNALIVKGDSAAYQRVASSPLIQHIELYHPAYRLSPAIGTMPQESAERASSPVFKLELRLFPGEPLSATLEALQKAGVTIVHAADAGYPLVYVEAQATQIPLLARLESVLMISETAPTFAQSNGALYLQSETAGIGDFPYWKVGLQGDGQISSVIDTGLSVNAIDMANTRSAGGWTGTAPDRVVANHRKVRAYKLASEYGGTGGDTLGCDSLSNGLFTHGQLVSSVVLGGATRGFAPAPRLPSPSDWCSLGGNGNYTCPFSFGSGYWKNAPGDPDPTGFSEFQDQAFDGIAKGGRVVFVDSKLTSTCPENTSPSLNPPPFQNEVEQTWQNYRSTAHNYSLGSAAGPSGPVYNSSAAGADTAVRNFPINLVVVAAGNNGKVGGQGVGALSTQIGNTGNEATCKNCLSVGATGTSLTSIATFSSEGPFPTGTGSKRHIVTLLGFGFESGCRRDGAEDQTTTPSCADMGTSQGTSFAAPNITGASMLVREYFAEGFYPDGTDQNTNNNADKVSAISGRMVRALLIASTMPVGGRSPNQARLTHAWGYGQAFLTRALPLAAFSSSTVNGLIVHDQPGNIDGNAGDDGVTNLTLPATIPTGAATYTAEFQVLDTTEDLAASVVWDDTTTSGVMDNDLDLTLRYCGPDQNCGNADDVLWLGNAFQEDFDENGTLNGTTERQILTTPTEPSGWWYSLSDRDITGAGGSIANYRNRADVSEAVFIPTKDNARSTALGDLNSDGTPDLQYLDDITTSGCTQAAPCKRTGKWRIEIARVSGTTNGLGYAVAIAGNVTAGSAISVDNNPVVCNGDQLVIVNETNDASAIDPACNSTSCPASAIGPRVTLQVKNTSGTVIDIETFDGSSFVNNPPNTFRFETVDRLPLSDVASADGDNNGILTSCNGCKIEATYADVKSGSPVQRIGQATIDCQPDIDVSLIRQLGPDTAFTLAGGCDDDKYFDSGEEFAFTVQFFNVDTFELVDATAQLCAIVPGSASNPADPCGTGTASPHITINQPVKPIGTLRPQTLQRTGFGIIVNGTPPGRTKVDLNLCLEGAKTGQGTKSCKAFEIVVQANDEIFYYTTDCPTGCTLNWDKNNDEVFSPLMAWNPFDPFNHVRRNTPETKVYGNMTTANGPCVGATCGNPSFNGPWDFDSNDEGFRSGVDVDSELSATTASITNWGEDTNWNGALDAGEDVNSNTKLDQNWGTAGGCGWMTKAGAASTGGVWHTGTIGTWTTAHNQGLCGTGTVRFNDGVCEQYDTMAGTEGLKYWFETLRSPVVRPTRWDPDGTTDGFAWKTRVLDWSWNQQFDVADNNTFATWEIDLDSADGTYTILGDTLVLNGAGKGWGNNTGLVTGGQLELYGGGFAFADTCANSAGCAAGGPGGAAGFGDQINGTKGSNRAGNRGCFFNDLNRISSGTGAHRIVRLPTQADDDCDNFSDYTPGPNGCPGNCNVDDDGNGLVDDVGEICPCFKCNAGPRSGRPCTTNGYCNPTGGVAYFCNTATNASGVPTGYGDDVCGSGGLGNGTADENLAATFGTNTSLRQNRNADTAFRNGVANAGRYGGQLGYNNFEDFQVAGPQWQTELGIYTNEATGTTAPKAGFGMALDDMVIEWQESHPIAQSGTTCTAAQTYYNQNGECARLTVGSAINLSEADREFPVTVVDPVSTQNTGEAPCGANQVKIYANSPGELAFETFCLTQVSPGSTEFVGTIKSTTRIQKAGDGYVYVAYNGAQAPNITVRYRDRNDGVRDTSLGTDGLPGLAGVDDNKNGTIDDADELCSMSTAGGHMPGSPYNFSDDSCGCAQNVPNIENPLVVVVQNFFDTANVVITDVIVRDSTDAVLGTKGDGDGFADPGETVALDVKVKNLADYVINDLQLTISTDSTKIGCVLNDRMTIPVLERTLLPGYEVDTSTFLPSVPRFRFIVAAAGTIPNRASTGEDYSSAWTVAFQGLAKAGLGSTLTVDVPLNGSAVIQRFKLVHSLDGTLTREVDFLDNMETYTTDAAAVCLPTAPATRCTTAPYVKRNSGDDAAELTGTRCQVNNPGNVYGNNTDPKDYCEVGEGYTNTENHWHVHASGANTCERSTGCTNDSGPRGHSGLRSIASGDVPGGLAWGASTGDNNTTIPLNRMYWLKTRDTYLLGTGRALNGTTPAACTASPGSCADQAPVLETWNQMAVTNGWFFGSDMDLGWDAAMTYICVDKNGNNDCDTAEDGNKDRTEVWEPLRAYYSPESSFRLNNFINCMYDPSDDGNVETDFFAGSLSIGPSSTCFPQAVDTCLGRTMPDHPLGTVYVSPICWPETGLEGSEGELGTTGPGKWIRKLYSLKSWRGQRVLFRWHTAPGGFKGASNCAAFGPGCGNSDDGWYLDDIKIYGRAASGSLALDNSDQPGGDVCLAQNPVEGLVARAAAIQYRRVSRDNVPKAASACASSAGDVAVSNCDFNSDSAVDASVSTATGDAPGRAWILEARESTAIRCAAGALEYQFETGGNILRTWNTQEYFTVNPAVTTTYDIRVRCSSATATVVTTQLTISFGATCQIITNSVAISADKSLVTWSGTGTYDVARGDVGAMLAGSGDFSGATCTEDNGADNQATTGPTPAGGASFYYLVRCSDGGAAGYNDGTQTGSRNVTACP